MLLQRDRTTRLSVDILQLRNIGQKSAYHLHFVVLALENAFEYCNFDERIKSGNYKSTSDINLVGFHPVTWKFKRLN